MLVVRVELHSAVTGKTTEIARALIYNDGGGDSDHGNYKAFTFKGRDGVAWTREHIHKALNAKKTLRDGVVMNYPRKSLHVWNLVYRALKGMGYQ
jgi:hypothetical protein